MKRAVDNEDMKNHGLRNRVIKQYACFQTRCNRRSMIYILGTLLAKFQPLGSVINRAFTVHTSIYCIQSEFSVTELDLIRKTQNFAFYYSDLCHYLSNLGTD